MTDRTDCCRDQDLQRSLVPSQPWSPLSLPATLRRVSDRPAWLGPVPRAAPGAPARPIEQLRYASDTSLRVTGCRCRDTTGARRDVPSPSETLSENTSPRDAAPMECQGNKCARAYPAAQQSESQMAPVLQR